MAPAQDDRVPQMTVRRLSLYYRVLSGLAEEQVLHVSSERIAELTGFTAAQVRRDLAYFGSFGRRGVGYNVASLRQKLGTIIGIGQNLSLALVGVGNLGSALLAYDGFRRQGFEIAAAFDADPRRIGTVIRDVVVEPVYQMQKIIKERGVQMALVAVPAKAAQQVTDQLVAAGIRGILNFAPVTLRVPAHVHLASVDLSIEVEYLSYLLHNDPSPAAQLGASVV